MTRKDRNGDEVHMRGMSPFILMSQYWLTEFVHRQFFILGFPLTPTTIFDFPFLPPQPHHECRATHSSPVPWLQAEFYPQWSLSARQQDSRFALSPSCCDISIASGIGSLSPYGIPSNTILDVGISGHG